MKTVIAIIVAVSLSGCVESTITTTDAKTGITTVTKTRTPAPGSVELGAAAIAAVASRQNQK